jgi:hypothetical protein
MTTECQQKICGTKYALFLGGGMTRSYYVAQVGLELVILLPLPPKC